MCLKIFIKLFFKYLFSHPNMRETFGRNIALKSSTFKKTSGILRKSTKKLLENGILVYSFRKTLGQPPAALLKLSSSVVHGT